MDTVEAEPESESTVSDFPLMDWTVPRTRGDEAAVCWAAGSVAAYMWRRKNESATVPARIPLS
jgi:hypothetical protein